MILAAKKIITGDGKTVLENAAVRVDEQGNITEAGSFSGIRDNHPGEVVQDYGDATILPGLIDMHVHIGYWWSKPDSHNYDEYLIAYMALSKLLQARASGVTTMRDVSSPRFLCEKIRLAARKGYISVPRIFHTSQGICATGGHGWSSGVVECDGEDEIRKAIRQQLRDGADWIKVLSSHRSNISEYTQSELDAAVDECHRHGVRTAVHAGTQPSIEMAINAGFDTIEHGTYLTAEQAFRMKAKGLFWVPTIMAYTYIHNMAEEMRRSGERASNIEEAALIEESYEYFKNAAIAYRQNFKALYDTGVTVCAGTDMVLDGSEAAPVWQELAFMVEYGLTPVEAIRTATVNCAEALDMAGKIGVIAPGALADLLVVDGDLSENIGALKQVKAVFQSGQAV